MKNLDDNVYGVMDFDDFLNRKNTIFMQPKKGGTIAHDYVIS